MIESGWVKHFRRQLKRTQLKMYNEHTLKVQATTKDALDSYNTAKAHEERKVQEFYAACENASEAGRERMWKRVLTAREAVQTAGRVYAHWCQELGKLA